MLTRIGPSLKKKPSSKVSRVWKRGTRKFTSLFQNTEKYGECFLLRRYAWNKDEHNVCG